MFKSKDHDFFSPEKLYNFDEEKNTYILSIAVNSFKDFYNTWDYAPFQKRDINEALIKYIEECSIEIPIGRRLALHFYLPENQEDQNQSSKGTIALRTYFKYLMYKKIQEKNQFMKNARMYGITGFLLLTLAYFTQKLDIENYYIPILPEGLYIGGWVLFWEVFSIIFFRSSIIRQKIKEYKRLSEAEIIYHFGKTFHPDGFGETLNPNQGTTS